MQTGVATRPPPVTWPEFWREVARRAAARARSLWSAPGQPAWTRPLLPLIAAVAAWSYAWRASRPVNIEVYYAAAARSMTTGLSHFFFGAFDPAGTVTADKLPGALWLQAVSVGVFGPRNWALVLPQVIEGTLTVLVLYRAVRRLAGPPSGLIAAGLLAISPATVALDRLRRHLPAVADDDRSAADLDRPPLPERHPAGLRPARDPAAGCLRVPGVTATHECE